MNKLITTDNGGFPFQLDDLRFMDDAYRNAFKGIMSSFGIDPADSFILSGCVVTDGGTTWDISAGYISLNGEIYQVDAHSITKTLVGNEVHLYQELLTNDPAGLKTFESAASFNTYQVRRAEVVVLDPLGSPFMPMLADTIHDKIAQQVGAPLGAWITIDLENSTDVAQNDTVSGNGNPTALVTAPGAGDYFRYNIIGKTLTYAFKMSIRVTDFDADNCASIRINSLPFTFPAHDQQTSMQAQDTLRVLGASGVRELYAPATKNYIVLRLNLVSGSYGSFNRDYVWNDIATIPQHEEAVSVTTDQEHEWTLSGTGTLQIA